MTWRKLLYVKESEKENMIIEIVVLWLIFGGCSNHRVCVLVQSRSKAVGVSVESVSLLRRTTCLYKGAYVA